LDDPILPRSPLEPRGSHSRTAASRLPARGELAVATRAWIKRGSGTKADLTIVDVGDGPVVVKDFAARGFVGRWLGRLQIARESAAYRRLDGIEGVPRFVGRIDAHALALEAIDGGPLAATRDRHQRGSRHLEQIRSILERLHAAGLAHLDLRCRENVVVDERGSVFLLDFASAVWLRPGGLAHRVLFPLLRSVDVSAYLKWKSELRAGPYSSEERAFLERHRFWRALWPFNRKRRQP
jgi:serine/threonine protein kinase